jgi:hypothetical protein
LETMSIFHHILARHHIFSCLEWKATWCHLQLTLQGRSSTKFCQISFKPYHSPMLMI